MGLIKMNGVNYWGSSYGQGIIAPMIYSDEEKEVGVFTDGKPIYQKTVHISALPDSSHIGQYVDYPHGIADIENIIDYEGIIRFSNGTTLKFVRLGFSTSAFTPSASIDSYCNQTNIRIMCGSDRSSASADYTIWYTKTTDTAGSGTWTPSGAKAVHYSTNEQVIGTWIDGKPLYEITIPLNGATFYRDSWNETSIYLSTYNIKSFISNGTLIDNNAEAPQAFPCILGNMNNATKIGVDIKWDGSLSSRVFEYLTFRYTKTTD